MLGQLIQRWKQLAVLARPDETPSSKVVTQGISDFWVDYYELGFIPEKEIYHKEERYIVGVFYSCARP